MQLSRVLLLIGSVFFIVGGLVATGAVEDVGAPVDIFEDGDQIEEDSNIFLAPADTPEGSEYATLEGDNLTLSLDGLNREAVTYIDDLFIVSYAGDEEARVGFNTELADGDGNVTFLDMTTNEPIASDEAELDPDIGASPLVLMPGEQAVVGLSAELGTTAEIISTVDVFADVANAEFEITRISVDEVTAADEDPLVVRAGEEFTFEAEVTSTGTEEATANRTVTVTSEDEFIVTEEQFIDVSPGESRVVNASETPEETLIGEQFDVTVTVIDEDEFGEGERIDDAREVTVAVSTDPVYEFAVPHDGSAYALGFPAAVNETTYDEIIDAGGPINIFEYNAETESFAQVEFTEDGPDPLDAVVITTEDRDALTTIDFELSDPDGEAAERELSKGLNFVPATRYDDAETAFQGAFDGDFAEVIDAYRQPESPRLSIPPSFATQIGTNTYIIGDDDAPIANAFGGYFVNTTETGSYTSSVTGVDLPRDFLRFDSDEQLDAVEPLFSFSEYPTEGDETVSLAVESDRIDTVEIERPTQSGPVTQSRFADVNDSETVAVSGAPIVADEEITIRLYEGSEVVDEQTVYAEPRGDDP